MIAIIRISPNIPTSGQPPFFETKWDMVKTCNQSFINAGEISKRIYLLDRCPPEWSEYFKQYGTVYDGAWGKKESLWEAYRIAKTLTENILFLEDDYLWRPGTLKDFDLAVSHFGLVSPYDHPGHYGEEKNVIEAYQFNNLTWRWCPTNTHTFAVAHEVFNDHIDAFYYGLHDWQMFFKLQTEGVKLYAPLYSMATHIVDNCIAFNTNWKSLVDLYQDKNGK